MAAYEVKQGDHLTKIAANFGFVDYEFIWNHPNNAALKQLRKDPHVLFPGDSLYIPDPSKREEICATGRLHKFVLGRRQLMLRLVLEDHYEGPLARAQCEIVFSGRANPATTDPAGKIEQLILPSIRDGVLIIADPGTPARNISIPIRVGDLDPVQELSGQRARLANLGYLAGDFEQPTERHMKSAIEEFQCDHGLTVDGICGPNTQEKLKTVYGS
ncbi:MAG: peptidoglycan-binding protein [Bryobacterales bacterium]|nr:peptidoglycan-binding protein [Bryobacterales bacterium]